MTPLLIQISVFLIAMVIAVPLSQKLGLGSVLGYLIAGIMIGPALGLVGEEAADIQHIAEFGVVMMLFLAGLELDPEKFWALRHKLLGLGGLQVLITTLVIFGIAAAFGIPWSLALAIGLIFSLSSTAIVLQTLHEKGLMHSQGGQSSFSVLLFQDIAVILILAFLPLLAQPELANQATAAAQNDTFFTNTSGWLKAGITLAAIVFIVLAGHYLTPPVFRLIASLRLREIFTAFALLIVFGIAAIMSMIGLSPALGAFLAGFVLIDNEYHHELESTIEPFKGLLMGLFFITVGAGIDFQLLSSSLVEILAITFGVIAIKTLVLYVLGKAFKLKGSDEWLFALGLAQAGEFGFVLLSVSVQNAVMSQPMADKLFLVIALSMLLTPLLFILFDHVIAPRTANITQKDDDVIDSPSKHGIIIAGMGRFGQIISRLLIKCGYKPTVIDLDIETVEGFSNMGYKTYFGDASRPELLASAGLDRAKLVVIAIDDKERALEMVAHVRKVNPSLKIVARGYDRRHVYDLWQAAKGQHINIIRETFDSSVRASRTALTALGVKQSVATEITELFYQRDREGVLLAAEAYDPELPRFGNHKMTAISRKHNDETMAMIQTILDAHGK